MLNIKKATTRVINRETGPATRRETIGCKISSTHEKMPGKSINKGTKIKRKDRSAQILPKYPRVKS
jgi:hypothetical protein